MKLMIDTSNYRETRPLLDLSEDETIPLEFPFGIPGFESIHAFRLLKLIDYRPFVLLEAVDDSRITLLLVNLQYLKSRAAIQISRVDLLSVGCRPTEAAEIYVILKIDQETGLFTANLRAPLVINENSGTGRQVILDDKSLPVAHPLILLANQE
ncbi:MAG: flagellar assembly protein FliW [Candidatus Neomarinimicrobiota bacterium]